VFFLYLEPELSCILQSIWTTQVENGEIFKSAFLKYKNVVLVFSVNQSRAFQGYVSDPLLNQVESSC
jgi:YTH domain-containing protein 1